MGNKINVNINDLFSISAEPGILVSEIAHDYKKVTGKSVIGAKIDNALVTFDTKLYSDCKISFFDYTITQGSKMYQSALKFVMILAANELWKKEVYFKYSLNKGILAEIDRRLSDEDILALKEKMLEIISDDYPIRKCITRRHDAITYYLSTQELEKAKNIHNIPNDYVDMYEINHRYNYFYSAMPNNTGELGLFDIKKVGKNSLVLMYPRSDEGGSLPEFQYEEKIYNELIRYNKWTRDIKVEYVDDLNEVVASGNIRKLIKMNSVFMNDELISIAKDISKKKDVKMILIGGPSSSGKTTSAHKLCTYLETFGLKPIVISADDYFKEKVDTPKDENGDYDFDSIDALDLDLFNSHLKKLLKGEEVVIPTFNFVTGKKEYDNSPTKMEDDNILLIEGIHCLNEKMTKSIKRDNKYKIYVCPFTPLGIDRHNHLSTVDMRKIRRIVRDNRVRGKNVETTLKEWTNVRAGENKYIFPFTPDADAVLNSAFTYEMGVLKVYAEPLLYSVQEHSVYYEEARRLLGLLRMFYSISSEYIEDDSILREFIGGGIYTN